MMFACLWLIGKPFGCSPTETSYTAPLGASSMALAPLLVLLAGTRHLVLADEAQLPHEVLENEGQPAFLAKSDSGGDYCSTDKICKEICDADFMVYPVGDKCMEYCHEDIHYIWDVFDGSCGEGIKDQQKFCADLCYDGFYCGDETCGPCESKCAQEFSLVQEIFDFCADCDPPATTATTTMANIYDMCYSDDADKCEDMKCWCKEVCDIVKCPHCEELCHKNQDKVRSIFDRYCDCGFCDVWASPTEDAGLLQVRMLTDATDSCGCRSEHQYCFDLCKGLGYSGPGLGRCTEDCASSGKFGHLLEDYCHECHDDPHYPKTTKTTTTTTMATTPTTPTPTTPAPTTPTPTTPKPYTTKTTSKPYPTTTKAYPKTTEPYETTEPYKTTEPSYKTTEPNYQTTKAPYQPYYPKKDYYKAEDVPYYWKVKEARAEWNAKKAVYKAKAKAEYFKARHPEIFGYR